MAAHLLVAPAHHQYQVVQVAEAEQAVVEAEQDLAVMVVAEASQLCQFHLP
jgi:hypothetical protein